MEKIIFERGFRGDFASCGTRPRALPLDSAAFVKAGETFIKDYIRAISVVSLVITWS